MCYQFNPPKGLNLVQWLWSFGSCLLVNLPFHDRKGPGSVQGVAGLGHSPISLSSQLASHFGFVGFAPTFALFLAPKGVMFFVDNPYYMLSNVEITRPLSCTPLIISPQGEYYMEVRSIKIKQQNILINMMMFSLDKRGVGGTKLSTINPYMVLHHSGPVSTRKASKAPRLEQGFLASIWCCMTTMLCGGFSGRTPWWKLHQGFLACHWLMEE
ncbi:hypothetical protein V6N13_114244 [Hibiscus sabdariffa]|uniref:Xylanase inhibitor C-terminal domain-containing protein n=1 Tax=Hibiscus sabdariffa TaxID=183260 RepID=A0ABR2U156_9ROSI